MSSLQRLGIIGAENSHSYKVAEICNVQKAVPVRATHIWGETDEFARIAADKGSIPEVVRDWKSLEGNVDGVMIDHRHGGAHAEVARHFIEAGIPVFVDKPITCNLAEAKELFELAKKHSCPLITFSSKPLLEAFQSGLDLIGRDTVTVFNASGPADISSQHGGIFFYGIHQVDCAVEVLGTDAISVSMHVSGTNAIATIEFADGRLASLNLIKGHGPGFHWRFCTDREDFVLGDQNDPVPYLSSARLISDFLESGTVPFSRERMLAPISILEALQASLGSGKSVPVESLK